MVNTQSVLAIFIIAAAVLHVSLSFRELLGLGGKKDKNICSIHTSALGAQRIPKRPKGAPHIPVSVSPRLRDLPLL